MQLVLEQYPDALQISIRDKNDVALVHQEIQNCLGIVTK